MNRARIALFLHLDRVTWEKGRGTGAGRDLRDLIPSSIVKITLSCNLMKTQGEISWLGVWDSNQELAAASAWMAALVGWS